MSLERFDGLLTIMAVKENGLCTGIPFHNSFIDINEQKHVSEFERIIFVLCQTWVHINVQYQKKEMATESSDFNIATFFAGNKMSK